MKKEKLPNVMLTASTKSDKATGVGGSLLKLKLGFQKRGMRVDEYYPVIKGGMVVSDFAYGFSGLKYNGAIHSYTEITWNTKDAFKTFCGVWTANEKIYEEEKEYALRGPAFFKPFFLLHKGLEAECVKRNNLVCESDIIKEEVVRDYGISPSEITQIPIGIDTKKYSPGKTPRKAHGLKESDFVVTWVGHAEYNKGIKYLLDTAREVEGEGIVFILRAPPLKEGDKFYNEWKELQETVRFLPRFERMEDFHNLGNAYYMSSTYEAFNIALAEGMACGKPAVAFKHVGISDEAIIDGKTGYRAKFRDSAAIADKLRYLKEHPEKAKAMGRAARAIIQKKYPMDGMIDGHIRMYQEKLGKR